jgi:hypothetical protein
VACHDQIELWPPHLTKRLVRDFLARAKSSKGQLDGVGCRVCPSKSLGLVAVDSESAQW